MKKDTEGVDSYPASEGLFARSVNIPWSDDNVWDLELFTILIRDLLLFDLRKTVRLAPKMGMRFDWTGLIQHPPSSLLLVAINRKRAHSNEPPQALMPVGCFKKIARCDHRVHERIRKRLLACSCSQMIDNSRILCCRTAIFTREEIANNQLNTGIVRAAARKGFKPSDLTGRPDETAQAAKASTEQILYDAGADKSVGSCHKDRVVLPDYENITSHSARIQRLVSYVLLLDRADSQKCKELA